MEKSNCTYSKVAQQTVAPSSGLAAACFHLTALRYYSSLDLTAPFVSPTSSRHPLRTAAALAGASLQVLCLRLPCVDYEELKT